MINQIGNTPLIKLKQVSELTECNIYGKAEYFNPGESVKDRAALYIVKDAFEKKKLKKVVSLLKVQQVIRGSVLLLYVKNMA